MKPSRIRANLILPNRIIRMLNIFPIWCNVYFETVFFALNTTKRTENVTLHDIGNIFLVLLPRLNKKKKKKKKRLKNETLQNPGKPYLAKSNVKHFPHMV